MEISKYAKGLPSLLGLKERGHGPALFSEQVVGTVDMSLLYLSQDREVAYSGLNSAPAVGVNTWAAALPALVVPPGEIWYVWNYSVIANIVAGEAIDYCPICNIDGLTASVPLAPYLASPVTGALQEARTGPVVPFVAGAGSEFGFHVRSVTLTPDMRGAILFTRLRV
jgi:hypothetical protein